MPIAPLITFKAGECQLDSESTPGKVTPLESPGYLYLYSEDELVHFCWRKRDQPIDDPSLDLVMVPTDGTFVPYEFEKGSKPSAKTNGRIFVLKFGSSSQRHLFWLQSKPQGRSSDPSFFSPRDRKIGDIVNRILQGEEVNVTRELAAVRNTDSRRDDDDDEQMEDADSRPAPRARHGSTGGAGADATGGDVREEGEDSREGGADGARAASGTDADSAVRNFLASLQGQGLPAGGQQADVPYPYLNHLLPTSITVPMVDTASPKYIDTLLDSLPGSIVMLAATGELEDGDSEPKPSEVAEAKKGLSIERKRALIKKVLRSPQFSQGLGTLTMALRDGGLPSIADALDVNVENGGYIRQGGMPMGGGQAIQTFVEGVKQTVKEELEDEDNTRIATDTLYAKKVERMQTGAMAERSFPTEIPEFDADDRISFSKLDQKFIAVHDDGSEYEFDADETRWVPLKDEEDGDIPPHNSRDVSNHHQRESSAPKRGRDEEGSNGRHDATKSNRPNKKQKAPPQPRQNTAVYVRGLPLDATVDEVHEAFSRKAGVIAEEIDSGAPRIKMYTDESGNFKGDALVVFFKPQSVQMAIMLLDDTDFRITASGTHEGRISVEEADSSYKKTQYNQEGANGEKAAAPAAKKQQSNADRQKIIKKTQKLDAKLADWDDDEPPQPPPGMNTKRDKTVVLVRMFTLQELQEDPAALLEIKEDIRDECSKLGTVTSVVLYDEEEDGIVTVKFKDSESALACIQLMHGRSFDGRTVEASLASGKEKFQKSSDNQDEDLE